MSQKKSEAARTKREMTKKLDLGDLGDEFEGLWIKADLRMSWGTLKKVDIMRAGEGTSELIEEVLTEFIIDWNFVDMKEGNALAPPGDESYGENDCAFDHIDSDQVKAIIQTIYTGMSNLKQEAAGGEEKAKNSETG